MLLESLREREQCLQYMLIFFDEVSVLKNSQGQSFIPWAFRVLGNNNNNNNNNNNSNESPAKDGQKAPAKELKRTSIQKKLNKVTKAPENIYRINYSF